MTLDLTGGVDASSDHFLAEKPDDPQFRESASVWVSDDQGVIGLPRIGIEALAEKVGQARSPVNLGFPDGRAVIVREPGAGRSPVDDDGICRTFAAAGPAHSSPAAVGSVGSRSRSAPTVSPPTTRRTCSTAST
jgi:hypothetical protein